MVLLDWDKTFDEVDREGLVNSMRRMSINEKLIKLEENVYWKPTFQIEIGGITSEWLTQTTGI